MKNNKFNIFSLVCLTLIVFCLFRISSLKNDIEQMQNSINNLQNSESEIRNNVMQDVNAKLEEFNNVLVDYDYHFGDYEFDEENLDVELYVEFLPKAYTHASTKAYLVTDDNQVYNLELKDGKYIGTITMGLFDKMHIDHITLDTNGVLSNQKLQLDINPKAEYLSDIIVNYFGDITFKGKEDIEVEFDPTITLYVNKKYNNILDFKSAEVVVELNGKEIDRIPFDNEHSDGQSSHAALMSGEKKYDMKPNDQMIFYVDIKEGDFEYRRFLEDVTIDQNGERIREVEYNDHDYNEDIIIKYKNKIMYDISDQLN